MGKCQLLKKLQWNEETFHCVHHQSPFLSPSAL